MTDTGRIPGEGLPENAGVVDRPGAAAPGTYTYLDPSENAPEPPADDDDLLFMPGGQGAWTEAQPVMAASAQQSGPVPSVPSPGHAPAHTPPAASYEQSAPGHDGTGAYSQVGAKDRAGAYDEADEGSAPRSATEAAAHVPGPHETDGRDSGSVDLTAVRAPAPQPAPARRPLHMGPPLPDMTASPVRSLADRGPAGAPQQMRTPAMPAAARQTAAAPAPGPEYFDAPSGGTDALPGPQLGEIPPQGGVPWGATRQGPDTSAADEPSADAAAVPGAAVPEGAVRATSVPAETVAPDVTGAPEASDPSADGTSSASASDSDRRLTEGAPGEAAQDPGAIPGDPAVQAVAAHTAVEATVPEASEVPLEAGFNPTVVAPGSAPEGQFVRVAGEVPTGPRPGVTEPVAGAAAPDTDGLVTPVGQDPSEAGEQRPAPEATVAGATPVEAESVAAESVPAQPHPAEAAPAEAVPAQSPVPSGPSAPGAEPVAAEAEVPSDAAPTVTQAAEAAQAPVAPEVPGAPGSPDAREAAEATPEALQPQEAAEPATENVVTPSVAEATPTGEAADPETTAVATSTAEATPVEPATSEPATSEPATPESAASEPVAPESAPAEPLVAAPAAETGAAEAPVQGAVLDQAPTVPAEPSGVAPLADSATILPGAPGPAPAWPAPTTSGAPSPQPTVPAPAAPFEPIAMASHLAPTQEDTAAEAVPSQPVPLRPTPPGVAPTTGDHPATEAASTAPDTDTTGPAGTEVQALTDDADEPAAPVTASPATEAPASSATAPEGTRPEEGTAQAPEPAQDQVQDRAEDLAAEDQDETGPAVALTPAAPGYAEAEREAVLRVMRERRDIRNGFRPDPIPHDVLLRVLEAAHTAPSVGHSQPWDFVVIRSADTRRAMHELAVRQRDAYAKSLPKGRAKQFKQMKIEAILDTPVNIVVTADPTRGGRHTLGRHTQPQMAPYSSALAVENLWLAARAEGLGVGWVSFFDEREMVRELGLPEHLEVVAYLCVGYVDEFPDEPELMQAGWSKRRPLSWVVHEETYGRRALPGEAPHDLLAETISNIRPLDAKALGEAWERQKRMTKPSGALGMLEIISAQLSGLSRMCPPPIPEPASVAIFAGDHGVHAQGVTAWPQEVTAQMVANFLGGGAVCNAFANQVGAEVCIVDVGVASDLPATPGLLPRKVRAGTADMTQGPALTREEVQSAIEVGIETARDLVAAGNKALITGEMGIANTTASAALISVFTDTDPAEVTGRGTGINDEMHAHKIDVIRRALDLHRPDRSDPIGVLAAVGGLEHAAMVGLLLGGASLRTPVILDGVSAGASALAARAIAPEVLAACIAGHRSAEPGHVAALNTLGLRPLVDLDLRLGEGTGALLALPIVQSAARAMHEVATFDSAGVTEK
ncbi:nicotinate-nucleotide--dimethylbenzimidazole phosphoribosyltransferase [Streptomyces tsukubensis]|uniref:Nicotinate-nucleotide--dimethylbenzimidazole phosphoribosyltransferase n=1 Tax=Streptomyces tsukubensis TaxID=83656 RepID=A0A1V4ADQ7_9ACTN|nr:nicotinate-nucleotide--dimethylbenzimidazole phosphoribosyltransferase [Streptomyces tsukubensis]OON82162.1 hypothetical protein B1H18_03705 [Streptomyces tsukubensis]QFR92648.1 nicotinate-nucleotide--dimethylbenzimidazole phosphoribosyltransferase [Streptomyces tsukubensis]